MKVVQALPAMAGGGVEQGTIEIARALGRAGHEAVVVSAGGRLVRQLEAVGARHVAWPLGRKHPATLLAAAAFRAWLQRERPAILHARSRLPAWISWLAWRSMGAGRPRFVTTVHGLYSVSRYSAVMTRGERVIAVSDTAARYVRGNYPHAERGRLRVIYRGVDQALYNRGFQPSAPWREDWLRAHPQLIGKRVVLLPGRITRLKGHFDFIAMLERLHGRHPDLVGLLVGDADRQHAAYAAAIMDRAPALTMLGHRSDLREIMALSAAVVSLSTRPESFGRTVLEALSLGVPVVGYDHGGVGEILGKLFPEGRVAPGDSQDAATKLAHVLKDPAAARRAVQDHDFDVHRMCAETLALYAELASEGLAEREVLPLPGRSEFPDGTPSGCMPPSRRTPERSTPSPGELRPTCCPPGCTTDLW